MRSFNKILIANRGEIALRIIRAIHKLEKKAVAVYAYDDRGLPYVPEADEAYSLGKGRLSETYLNADKIIQLAKNSGADAIHPGYGFLAENSAFANLCLREGLTFIGPSPGAIAMMGDKIQAREKALELGLPLLTGFTGEVSRLVEKSKTYPYPVLIKPSAGGGGKGMRIVFSAEDFEKAATESAREAKNYFGSSALYVEQYLVNPRHIEVQVLADQHGNSVHLFERECSIQRRYQKIIEEAPSVSLTQEIRTAMCKSALDLVKGTSYHNAGTVEFLLDDKGDYYFMEMNTRIQVEHPVTEIITGIDLVQEQIKIAEGRPLSFGQEDIRIKGHAIEARIYAEDPLKNFQPSSGTIHNFIYPRGEKIRVDFAYKKGNKVTSFYDPLLAKVIVHGARREDAINKLIISLEDFHITGITSNRDYLVSLLRTALFAKNLIHTNLLEQKSEQILEDFRLKREKFSPENLVAMASLLTLQAKDPGGLNKLSIWEQIGYWRLLPRMEFIYMDKLYPVHYELLQGRKKMRLKIKNEAFEASINTLDENLYMIRINDQTLKLRASSDQSEILLDIEGHIYPVTRPDLADDRQQIRSKSTSRRISNRIQAPLNGRIIKINHGDGEKIEKDQPLLIIESMKMENIILAPSRSIIKKTHVSEGELVYNNQLLFTLDIDDRSTDQ